jgi:hypothetical protein
VEVHVQCYQKHQHEPTQNDTLICFWQVQQPCQSLAQNKKHYNPLMPPLPIFGQILVTHTQTTRRQPRYMC